MKHQFRNALILGTVVMLFSFQLIKTQLTITVRNETGNIEAGATIQLYETEADYNEEKNPVATLQTDAKGIAKFKDLKAISYHVSVTKGDRDNSGGGEQTGKLEGGKINKVTIIIQ
jgi:hypothetical protein